MKISRRVLFLLLLIVVFPTQAFAEEKIEDALCSGTYFPNLTITTKNEQTKPPLKVTITSESGELLKKNRLGSMAEILNTTRKTSYWDWTKKSWPKWLRCIFGP